MRKIKKSYYERREELNQALGMIEGAIKRYKQTQQPGELGIIAVHLRGLLFREKLFLALAEEKGTKLEVYTYEPPYLSDELPSDLKRGLTHAFSGDCVSLTYEKPCVNKVTVEEWLNIPVIEIKGARFTPGNLINEVATSLGPAHYSSEISAHMVEMRKISIGGIESQFRSVFKFAEILLELGKRFLQTY